MGRMLLLVALCCTISLISSGHPVFNSSRENVCFTDKFQRSISVKDTNTVVFDVSKEMVDVSSTGGDVVDGAIISRFVISDAGDDGLPTVIKRIYFNLISSKASVIRLVSGVSASCGGAGVPCRAVTVSEDSLVVEFLDEVLRINNSEQSELSLKLILSPAEFTDLESISFYLTKIAADTNYSTFSKIVSIPTNTLNLQVAVDTLVFSKIPSKAKPNQSFDIAIKASDRFGNTDADFSSLINLDIEGPDKRKFVLQAENGTAKFGGVKLDRSGIYSFKASSGQLVTSLERVVSDDDSYLKAIENAHAPPVITSFDDFYGVLDFSIVDTGTSDLLPTVISQMSVVFLDTLGNDLSEPFADEIELLADDRIVEIQKIVRSKNRMVLSFKDDFFLVNNGSSAMIGIRIKLKRGVVKPFTISIPASGIQTSLASSSVTSTYSYLVKSSKIQYSIAGSRLVLQSAPLLVKKSDRYSFLYRLVNDDGLTDTEYEGEVGVSGKNFSYADAEIRSGYLSVEDFHADSEGTLEMAVSLNSFIADTTLFRVVNSIDTILSVSAIPETLSGWKKDNNGYVHSSAEGVSFVSYKIPGSFRSKVCQWHFSFKLDNRNYSSQNFARLILYSDSPLSSYRTGRFIALDYVVDGDRFYIQPLFAANGVTDNSIMKYEVPDLVGKACEAYIVKDRSQLFVKLFVEGNLATSFCVDNFTAETGVGFSGVEYGCSISNIGKMRLYSMSMAVSEDYLEILDGYYTSVYDAKVYTSIELPEDADVEVIVEDDNGKDYSTSDIVLSGRELRFSVNDCSVARLWVWIKAEIGGRYLADSALIKVRGGLLYGDVVFSELMSDSTPAKLLPEADYIELYNRVNDTLKISGWRIWVNGKVYQCKPGIIKPLSYVVLTSAKGADAYPGSISLTGFDGLPDAGADVVLLNMDGTLLAATSYSVSSNSGGVALERSDVESLSEHQDNWTASSSASGGTPGDANSISQLVPDLRPPTLTGLNVEGVNSITLTFDEPIAVSDKLALKLDGKEVAVSSMFSSIYPRMLKLLLDVDMRRNVIHEALLTGISDYSGNKLQEAFKVALTAPAGRGDVIVNELLFEPDALCSDYVEMVNVSGDPLDLSTLYIARRDASGNIVEVKRVAENYRIFYPKELILVCSTPTEIVTRYPVSAREAFAVIRQMPSYSSEKGVALILNDAGQVVDEQPYSRSMHFKRLPTTKGVSLERISFASNGWISAAKDAFYGTPGMPNSQAGQSDTEPTEGFSLSSDVVSPDSDGLNDYLGLSYKFSKSGGVANISLYNSKGVMVKRIARSEQLGTKGLITWDGMLDTGALAGRGFYIVKAEVVFPDGSVISEKKVVAVAYR